MVAVRRPGRPQRGRPPVRREHPQPRPARGHRRPVPRLGQHRPQGRPVEAAAGPGSRHAAARRLRDRQRASSSAAPSTRRPPPTPTRRSSSRPSPTGATRSCPTTRSASSARWEHPASATSAAPALPAARPAADYPLANRFDEVDTLVVFDDVEIPWENVLFYRHTRAAAFIRATLHRYSAFAVRAADPAHRRHADRRRAVQRPPDRPRAAAGGAGEAGRAGLLPGGDQRPSDGGDRRGRAQPRRPADAEPVAAAHRAGAGLLAAPRDDARRPRAVRRPDLRHARPGDVRESGDGALAGEVLHGQRALVGRGPAAAAGVRPRPAELRLRRPPADVRAVRPVAARSPTWPRSTASSTSSEPLRIVQESAGLSERVLAGSQA